MSEKKQGLIGRILSAFRRNKGRKRKLPQWSTDEFGDESFQLPDGEMEQPDPNSTEGFPRVFDPDSGEGSQSSQSNQNSKKTSKKGGDLTWLQKMIIGRRHAELPKTPPTETKIPILKGMHDIFNALVSRVQNQKLKQEEKNSDPAAERNRLLKDAKTRANNSNAATDGGLMGDMMGGKYKDNAELSKEEEDARIRAERRVQLEEDQAKITEKLSEKFTSMKAKAGKFGKGLLGLIGGFEIVRRSAMYFVNMAKSQSDRMQQFQRYNADITASYIAIKAERTAREVEDAAVVSDSTKYVNKQVNRYEEATQPYNNMWTSFKNYVSGGITAGMSWGVERITASIEGVGVDVKEWRAEGKNDKDFETPVERDLKRTQMLLEHGIKHQAQRKVGPQSHRR